MSDSADGPDGRVAPTNEQAQQAPTAVVGIGGSAGALDGFERFFLGLPPNSGLAFVVVPHLNPEGQSVMPELLQKCTSLPVLVARDGQVIAADHIYVIPNGHGLSIMNNTLLLHDFAETRGHTIDAFLESLALDQSERAVAVILSGMGSDGTEGLKAVKAHSGLGLVQDPASADYPSMPLSAVATGLADGVWAAEDLAPRLVQLLTQVRPLSEQDGIGASAEFQKVLQLIRSRTGHDFTGYKRSTLIRRIDRRLRNHQLETLAHYLQYLQQTPEEVEALFEDLTINVTMFFRDPEAFDSLKLALRASLDAHTSEDDVFRAWVVGCASGEEAYSVAIVLHELIQERGPERPLRAHVFATDIDQRSLDQARAGQYPASIAQVISPERLRRFFTPHQGGYQISSQIRETLVFALHNTFSDPPFTRLDLLSCRNMLIYLNTELQQRVLAVFRYALQQDGLLFLGPSENTVQDREQFAPVDLRWKIYRRSGTVAGPLTLELPASARAETRQTIPRPVLPQARQVPDLAQQARTVLLQSFAPPAVVVDKKGDVLFVHGRTGRYLELAGGPTGTSNVLDMSHDGLRFELMAAMSRVLRGEGEVTLREMRYERRADGEVIDITVRPLPHSGKEPLLLIVFQDQAKASSGQPGADRKPEEIDQQQALRRELHQVRTTLQATIENLMLSGEELRSTNEEFQTVIEELQSSNEELMTSKEELQSVNEELITTNSEHQRVITDLAHANTDIRHLLESSEIATLVLGGDLTVKRFTPKIADLISLLPSDLGRHVGDIVVKIKDEQFVREVQEVISTLRPLERQVESLAGTLYLMRLNPTSSPDDVAGVVATFTNIDVVRNLQAQVDHSAQYADALLDLSALAMVVFDDDLRVITVNRAMRDAFGLTDAVEGQRLFELGNRQFDREEFRTRLEELVLTDRPLDSFVIDLEFLEYGVQKVKVEAWSVIGPRGAIARHILMLENVTPLFEAALEHGHHFTGDIMPDSEGIQKDEGQGSTSGVTAEPSRTDQDSRG